MSGVVAGLVAVAAGIVGFAAVDVMILGESLREWFKPQPILTFAGIVIGFLVLRWQLAAQHQSALRANAEKDRNALHLEIYRDFAAQSDKTARAVQAFSSIGSRADMAVTLASSPMPPAFPEWDEVRSLWSAAVDEVIALMGALEKWEIALDGGATNFKRALSDGLADISKVIERLQPALTFAQARRAPANLEVVRAAAAGLQDATLTIGSYIFDLRIALQNKLLGGLFEYRVPERRPGDSRYKAVTLERTPETN